MINEHVVLVTSKAFRILQRPNKKDHLRENLQASSTYHTHIVHQKLKFDNTDLIWALLCSWFQGTYLETRDQKNKSIFWKVREFTDIYPKLSVFRCSRLTSKVSYSKKSLTSSNPLIANLSKYRSYFSENQNDPGRHATMDIPKLKLPIASHRFKPNWFHMLISEVSTVN